MTETETDREIKADVDWPGDPSPAVERTLEWIHTRQYNAWHNDERIAALGTDALTAIGQARIDADALLDETDRRRLTTRSTGYNANSGRRTHDRTISASLWSTSRRSGPFTRRNANDDEHEKRRRCGPG